MAMRQLKITKQITKRESQSLDRYLHEIGKINLLGPNDEVKLAKRIKKGDKEAFETLVKSNLRFVVSVAKQHQNQGLTLSDLINEGNLGLIKATTRFDETRGIKFISYAVCWIQQSILQAVAEKSRSVRLPLNRWGSLNRIFRAYSALEQRYEREPTPEELAAYTNISVKEVENTLSMSKTQMSADRSVGQESDTTLLDLIESNLQKPDRQLRDESLRHEVHMALKELGKREAEVLKLSLGIGEPALTPEEIMQRIGLTKERVRQIKEKALRKLRQSPSSKRLKMFLNVTESST